MAVKGASLLPQDFAVGGALPDGEYTMKEVSAATFDYQGKAETVPSLRVIFSSSDGTEYDQHYSAGKLEFLAPSTDGKRFVSPNGEDAKISKSSNCAAFISSLLTAGFPVEGLSDDVTAFSGHRVLIENKAQPKRAGLKDAQEGKTIPLVARYLGESKGGSAKGATARPATKTPQTAASTAASNGELDAAAISAVQEALTAAGGSMTRMKLGTAVFLSLSKAKDPNVTAIKKMAGDAVWLAAQAEAGGWATDGDNVSIG